MKTISIFTITFALTISAANAAQNITGVASAYGDYETHCADITNPPTEAEAEAEANKQADNFCDTFSMSAVRISDFTYGGDCVTKRKGFAVYRVLFKTATASYRCQ